jgi:hypothetical protein
VTTSIITIEFANHTVVLVALPNGDMDAAQFSPYQFWDRIPLTAPEILAECREALSTYHHLPKNMLN